MPKSFLIASKRYRKENRLKSDKEICDKKLRKESEEMLSPGSLKHSLLCMGFKYFLYMYEALLEKHMKLVQTITEFNVFF